VAGRRDALAVAAAAAAGIQVGAATVASRYVIDQTGPVALALMRYAIGVACLAAPLLAARRVRFASADLVPMAVLGILQFGVLIVLLNVGLAHVSAARAAVIFSAMPLLTMLLGAALRSEPLGPMRTLGVLASMAGVALALGAGWTGSASEAVRDANPSPNGAPTGARWIGELAVFGAAACGAVCSVLYGRYLRRYPALQVGAFAMLASVLFLGIWLLLAGEPLPVARLTPEGWGAVAFIGMSSGIGYFLWLFALGRAPATRVTVFLALSPPTAAILGAAWLGEPLGGATLAGLACVVAGLWLAHRD
jgi:drug/metabolite transporter (DMT)-like permease